MSSKLHAVRLAQCPEVEITLEAQGRVRSQAEPSGPRACEAECVPGVRGARRGGGGARRGGGGARQGGGCAALP